MRSLGSCMMPAIRHLILMLAFFAVACSEFPRHSTLDPDPPNTAWWMRLHFDAVDQRVWGVPVTDLDSSWSRASAFTKSALPAAVFIEGNGDEMARNNVAFERIGDFNADGTPDVALAGVYRTNTGDSGVFILILTLSAEGTWKKAFLQATPGDRGFAIFPQATEALEVWTCMDCDGISKLEWDRKEGRYRWRIEPDE